MTRKPNPEANLIFRWTTDTWSVIHHDEQGGVTTVLVNHVGAPLTQDTAMQEIDSKRSEDRKSKAHSMLCKNGKVVYRKFWNMKNGRWAKPKQQKGST